jgi:integrase
MSRARANGEGSIYPYRDIFAAYVWVNTPDGERKRKYIYGKTREEVHDKWIKLQKEASERPIPTKSQTLGTFIAYWLREIVKPNLAPSTYANYEMFARLYIVPALGAVRLDRLTTRDIQRWANRLAQACQCCEQKKDERRPAGKRRCCAAGQCCGATLSRRSVGDARAALRAALSCAVTEELISRNPAETIKLKKVRKQRRTAWTSDEARAFLESARDGGDPLYAAYVLILVLGLRRGEVLGLVWDNVDLDGAELVVELQLQRVNRQLLHRETKTEASDAPLPLPGICLNGLRERKARQVAEREASGAAWQGAPMVFTTRLGTPIEPRNFNRSFHARIAKAGVRRIKVHDARRTCATLLVDLDVHPRVIMQILRHADFNVTMEIYSQVSSKATRKALKRLSKQLDG